MCLMEEYIFITYILCQENNLYFKMRSVYSLCILEQKLAQNIFP